MKTQGGGFERSQYKWRRMGDQIATRPARSLRVNRHDSPEFGHRGSGPEGMAHVRAKSPYTLLFHDRQIVVVRGVDFDLDFVIRNRCAIVRWLAGDIQPPGV